MTERELQKTEAELRIEQSADHARWCARTMGEAHVETRSAAARVLRFIKDYRRQFGVVAA